MSQPSPDQLSREELWERRKLSDDFREFPYNAPIDYHYREGGKVLIVIGRAWKTWKAEGGEWLDGDSYIAFDYHGATFHIYVPKVVEKVLREKGAFEDFARDLSHPPTIQAIPLPPLYVLHPPKVPLQLTDVCWGDSGKAFVVDLPSVADRTFYVRFSRRVNYAIGVDFDSLENNMFKRLLRSLVSVIIPMHDRLGDTATNSEFATSNAQDGPAITTSTASSTRGTS